LEIKKSGQVLVRTLGRKKPTDSNPGNRLCQEFWCSEASCHSSG
jgi:hypothetical protein